jgi:hypothetical protein
MREESEGRTAFPADRLPPLGQHAHRNRAKRLPFDPKASSAPLGSSIGAEARPLTASPWRSRNVARIPAWLPPSTPPVANCRSPPERTNAQAEIDQRLGSEVIGACPMEGRQGDGGAASGTACLSATPPSIAPALATPELPNRFVSIMAGNGGSRSGRVDSTNPAPDLAGKAGGANTDGVAGAAEAGLMIARKGASFAGSKALNSTTARTAIQLPRMRPRNRSGAPLTRRAPRSGSGARSCARPACPSS